MGFNIKVQCLAHPEFGVINASPFIYYTSKKQSLALISFYWDALHILLLGIYTIILGWPRKAETFEEAEKRMIEAKICGFTRPT